MNFKENVYHLLEELQEFDYRIECIDLVWDIIFPHIVGRLTVYYHIHVTKYHDIFYVTHVDGDLCSLEVKVNKSVAKYQSFDSSHNGDDFAKKWNTVILSARKWLKVVNKDWLKANRHIWLSYPLNRRYGIVSSSVVKDSLLDIFRIDQELGKAKSKKFIKLVEQGNVNSYHQVIRPSMTANDYFEYCKIAYIAAQRKGEHIDKNMSCRQMYERYADGRHEGLLDIDGGSKEEFANWIDGKHPKKTGGGHPWEIKRGGNTTHIDLSVSRPSYREKEGFVVTLRGASFTRLKETICMFLAIHKAGLPITIDDPNGIRQRLLGHDNIGIVPCFNSLHRANQRFHKHQSVYDVMYYNDLGRYKSRITSFITWEPLPLLKKREL